MKRYAYRLERLGRSYGDAVKVLNHIGAQGWRVVYIEWDQTEWLAWLEREGGSAGIEGSLR